MSGEAAFQLYKTHKGVSLHFESPTYIYQMYGGKTNTKMETFQKAREKSFFYRLAGMLPAKDGLGFMVANARLKSIKWIGDLDFDEGMKVYNAWLGVLQSMPRHFRSDAITLARKAPFREWTAIPEDETYSIIAKELMDGNVKMESVVILGKLLDCLPDLKANEDFFWPNFHRRLVKYSYFMNPNLKSYAKILKEVLTDEGQMPMI